MTHLRLLMLFLVALCVGQLQAGPIICGSDEQVRTSEAVGVSSTPKPSEVNQFVHYVQCSLEKAKPWIEDLETEAKRLEENAKRLGLRIAHRFNDLLSTLIGSVNIRKPEPDSHPDPTASSSSESPDRKATAVTDAAEPVQVTHATEAPSSGLAPNEAENEITNGEPLK